MLSGGIVDLLDGIEPEPVQPEFTDPVECVLDEKAPHRFLTVIDRRTPGRLPILMEEAGRICVKVITLGYKMIVDDIEQHHEAEPMCRVDESLEIVRRPISGMRRVLQH